MLKGVSYSGCGYAVVLSPSLHENVFIRLVQQYNLADELLDMRNSLVVTDAKV